MSETPERDGLEPPGVAGGRVLQAAGLMLVLLLLAYVAVAVTWKLQVRDYTPPTARAFPKPSLESTVEPRSTVERERGPSPYRERALGERAGQPGAPSPRLAAAMRAITARGAAAYDPAERAP